MQIKYTSCQSEVLGRNVSKKSTIVKHNLNTAKRCGQLNNPFLKKKHVQGVCITVIFTNQKNKRKKTRKTMCSVQNLGIKI